MADVITRFKVETTQFDSKLRDAAKGLKELSNQATMAGKDFDKFTKGSVSAAQAFGKVESGANNLKDKLKDLVGAYNDVAKAYEKLTDDQKQSDFAKAMAQSLEQLQQRIKDTKQELYSLNEVASKGKGIDVGGGGSMTMASFKGNVYAMAAEKGAEALNMLKDKITDILKESVQLSTEAEGIRMAYERFADPGMMERLKQATHGTVTELELMKQAVKFKDFNLDLESMGAMLAFAQQKAKDTGESVDFLVTSIVNGLGRQSLQILDNLGLSAAEVREKMKETGDMTSAVAALIKEKMADAGEYMETSMERANRAAADTQDEMRRLGDQIRETFGTGSIEELSSMLELRLIKDLENVVGIVGDLSTGFGLFGTDAGKALQDVANVAYEVVKQILWLQTGLMNVARLIHWIKGENPENAAAGGAGVGALFGDYLAKGVLPEVVVTPQPKGKGSGKGKAGTDLSKIAFDPNKAASAAVRADEKATGSAIWEAIKSSMRYEQTKVPEIQTPLEKLDIEIKTLTEAMQKATTPEEYQTYKEARKNKQRERDMFTGDYNPAVEALNGLNNFNKDFSTVVGGIGSIVSGIEAMGVEIPDGIKSVLTALQGITSIISGISAIASLILVATQVTAGTSAVKAIPVIGWALARGGIVHAAGGYQVPGNNYSGDMVPAMLNSGEMVLSRAQQNILAGTLEGNGLQNMKLSAVARGEDLFLVMNRFTRRSGKGELVTWK